MMQASTAHPLLPSATQRGSRRRRAGVTVIELLVVAGILVLLLAIAAGSLRGLILSSERSLAENQLRVGLTAARDAAIRSKGGDAAAVFFFREGRTVILPCVSVGVIRDDRIIASNGVDVTLPDPPGIAGLPDREVFVVAPGGEPVVMPGGWTVRGFLPPGRVHHALSSGAVQDPPTESGVYDWYSVALGSPRVLRGTWVFPETDFRDDATDAQGDEGWRRQTFMVRFRAQTGESVLNSIAPVLVVDPVAPEAPFRLNGVFNSTSTNLAEADDVGQMVRRMLSRPWPQEDDLYDLLGDRASDTVLAAPVLELALLEEARMATQIGARRLNASTQSLYLPFVDSVSAGSTPLDTQLFESTITGADVLDRVNDYIAGPVEGRSDDATQFQARIFTLSRYQGQLQEVGVGRGQVRPLQ